MLLGARGSAGLPDEDFSVRDKLSLHDTQIAVCETILLDIKSLKEAGRYTTELETIFEQYFDIGGRSTGLASKRLVCVRYF